MKETKLLKLLQYTEINLAVACSYFVLGYIGTLLTTAPSHASPIWPAAGLAFASALVYGTRIVLGLFLGTLALQIFSFLDFSTSESINPTLISGVLSSFGSCAQAFFGVYLINHFVGKHNPLLEDKNILYFFFFGAFISCLVAPTLGISAIYFQGIITTEAILISWLTWWVGDAIGVIIIAPIILSFIAKPRSLWRERKKLVSYPLLFISILVVGIFQYSQKQETARISSIFERQVIKFHSSLTSSIQRHIEINQTLKAFFDGSQLVTEKEFSIITQPFIKEDQSFHALEWISYIHAQKRNQLENGGLIIHEPNQEKKMVSATERADYFPVTYVQPLKGNERAYGFDIGSNPDVLKALLEARDTGKIIITDPIRLVHYLEEKIGFVLYSPVYLKDKSVPRSGSKCITH